jgi:lipopolysaccharide export system permease protein
LLCYIVYVDMLTIARVQVERETVPPWLGMWWVHAVALAIALVLLLRQSGALARSPMVAAEAPT